MGTAHRDWKRGMANDGKDCFNRQILVGQNVIKPTVSGRSAILEFRTVTKIVEDRIYLDDSKVAINFSGRLYIIEEY